MIPLGGTQDQSVFMAGIVAAMIALGLDRLEVSQRQLEVQWSQAAFSVQVKDDLDTFVFKLNQKVEL